MDNLDFLNEGHEPVVETAAPEIEAEADKPEGPARGPDGKFVAKAEAEPETPAEPQQEPAQPQPLAEAPPAPQPEPAKPPEGYVPVSVVQELRKEIQALKQPPATPVDPHEDPEGAIYQTTFTWSQKLAVAQHGQEQVDEALSWARERADRDPLFNQTALGHADPVGFAIAEFQRDKALSLLADPKALTAFQAFLAGQSAPQAPAAAPVVAPQPPPIPPRSLAAAPNAGGTKPGEQPVGPGVAFDAVFNGT